MIWSDKKITEMMEKGELVIAPMEKEQIQPASVDIRLGDTFSIVEDSSTGVIDMEQAISYKTIKRIHTFCFRDSLFWQRRWNISSFRTI